MSQQTFDLFQTNSLRLDSKEVFSARFSPEHIETVFAEKDFGRSETKGIDRVSIANFQKFSKQHLSTIARKTQDESYKFTPYKEILISKGRGKEPRVISIPTIRDRVVMGCLKRSLFDLFSDRIPKRLPFQYVEELKRVPPEFDAFLRFDIKDFYPSIRHRRLLAQLKKKIKKGPLLSLIEKAIVTPTVPLGYRIKPGKDSAKGVPQGLAVSNILAEIYLTPLDGALKQERFSYFRYVDDVIIFSRPQDIEELEKLAVGELKRLGLTLNKTKCQKAISRTEKFTYLGYSFSAGRITVSEATVDRFKMNIIQLFSRLKFRKISYAIFLYELNLRITGAIKGNRRYGWMFYYSQISDQTLLYEMDNFITKLFLRYGVDESGVKRLVRVYNAIKYSKPGNYIPNFDNYTVTQMRADLKRIEPEKSWDAYSDTMVREEFEKLIDKKLVWMERDIQNNS